MQKYVKVEQGQALTGGLEFFAVKTGSVSLVPTLLKELLHVKNKTVFGLLS